MFTTKGATSNTTERDETARPGTAGTEVLLRSTRKQASTAFKRAHRAEQAYVAHKKAEEGRKGLTEAKEHFKESKTHFEAGCGLSFLALKAVPHLLGEKREARRVDADGKKKEQAEKKREQAEKKREHYEKLAKAAAEAEAAAAATEKS